MTGYPGLRSSQLAEAAGVNLQTLRYYERRGLLAEPDRTLGGHRLYPAEAVTILRVIEVNERIADLTVIRTALQQTIEAGCRDLIECAEAGCCPLPFAQLARPGRSETNP